MADATSPATVPADPGEAAAPAADAGGPLAALRAGDAASADPVRIRFIEALARRAQAHRGEVRRILDARLARAIDEYGERGAAAAGEGRIAERPPAADADAAPYTPLAGLLAELARHSHEHAAQAAPERIASSRADTADPHPAAGELKSLRYFRNTWARLSVEQQLAQALAQAPENAGPLNSHRLVLRALERMRDISPDYLSRFMAYADALLWLEQADAAGAPPEKPAAAGEGDRKKPRSAAGAGRAAKAGR